MKSAEFGPSETPELWPESEVVLVAKKVLPNTPILPSPLRSTQRKHTRRALSYGQNGSRFLGPERILQGVYLTYSPAFELLRRYICFQWPAMYKDRSENSASCLHAFLAAAANWRNIYLSQLLAIFRDGLWPINCNCSFESVQCVHRAASLAALASIAAPLPVQSGGSLKGSSGQFLPRRLPLCITHYRVEQPMTRCNCEWREGESELKEHFRVPRKEVGHYQSLGVDSGG